MGAKSGMEMMMEKLLGPLINDAMVKFGPVVTAVKNTVEDFDARLARIEIIVETIAQASNIEVPPKIKPKNGEQNDGSRPEFPNAGSVVDFARIASGG